VIGRRQRRYLEFPLALRQLSPQKLTAQPNTDVEAYARELATAFELAVVRPPKGKRCIA